MRLNNNNAATLLGLMMAVLNAWATVDWQTFQFDARHLLPLVISAGIAVGGYLSTLKTKK